MRVILLVLILLLPQHLAKAQVVSGVVFEKEGDTEISIPGVNVHWAESAIGTITDAHGKFDLFKPAKYSSLVFSFVGYSSDTISVNDINNVINVFLVRGEAIDEIQISERAVGSHIDRLDPILTENITGAELCKAACCNLSESFETNASIDAYYANAVTGAKQIRLLGLDGQYVQMLTENIPNLRGLAMPYGLEYIPGAWMAGIHISKGTSSVKNGYESITGQINVEYLKPNTADIFSFNALTNSVGKRETNLSASALLNNKLSTLILVHVEDNSQRDDFQNDGFLDHPLVRQYNLLNRWYYSTEHFHMHIGIKALKEQRTSGQVGFDQSEARDLDKPYGISIETERFEGFLKMGYTLNNDLNSNFGAIVSFNSHQQNSYFGLRNYDALQESLYVNLMFQTDLINEVHNITSGFSFTYDVLDEILDERNFNITENLPGMFVEYAFNPNPKMTLLGGMRLDINSIYGLTYTPRIHGRYNIGTGTTIRASLGKGYRTPHVLAEQNHFLASSRRLILEEDFEREEAWNYGINLTQYVGLNSEELTLSLEAYRTSFLSQVIMDLDTSTDEVRFYNLDGQSFSNNFQAELSYEIIRGLDTRLAFRYTDVKYSWKGELIDKPLVSKYKGLVNISYMSPLKKWQFDYTLQINGPGRIPDTSGNPEEYQLDTEFPAFAIMNAQITKYFRSWSIYFGAENLTGFRQENPVLAADQPFGEHFDASLLWGPIDGRKVYLGIRFAIEREEQ